MRRMTLALLLIGTALTGGSVLTLSRAAERDRQIEAAFPPIGEIVDVDGRQVHVVVKGTGPDLVLIHGAGGNARDFTYEFIDHLTDRYRVFVVDTCS